MLLMKGPIHGLPKALVSVILVAAAVSVTSLALAQSAGSPADHLGPRELAMGEAMRGDARGAPATVLNPSGAALGSELVFEGSYTRTNTDSANAVTLSGCDATVRTPGCFYYRYFSGSYDDVADIDPDARVHEGGLTLSTRASERVTVGVTTKYFDVKSDIDGDSSGFNADAGVTVQLIPGLLIGLAGHNLYGEDSSRFPRGLGAGAVLRPMGGLTLAFDGAWNLDAPDGESTGRYGGGAEYFLSPGNKQVGYPVRAGVLHDVGRDTTYISGGLGLLSTKLGLDVALRKEIGGGDDLALTASLRIFGPRKVAGTQRYLY